MDNNITRDDIADYLNQEFGLTKKDCNDLVNDIIETTSKKAIKAEAYYWLGYISLINDFDLEFAIEYFNFVNKNMW